MTHRSQRYEHCGLWSAVCLAALGLYLGGHPLAAQVPESPDAGKITCLSDIPRCEELANAGDAAAQSELGVLYANGEGVAEDAAEAVRWSRLAAEQGHAGGQYNLGLKYATGEGVARNYPEAVRWFRLAAEQEHGLAQFNLGVMWLNDRSVAQDEGLRWFRLAAEQGSLIAQDKLGAMYGEGERVARDDAEAVRWYRLAAGQGLVTSQFNLARSYLLGLGVPQNHERAYLWYLLGNAQTINLWTQGAEGRARHPLTSEQRAAIEELAAKCKASGFKDCGELVGRPDDPS